MNDFMFYIEIGLHHVLDWKAYDHILFLAVLTIFYSFKDWKKVLWLITAFTIGHTISLALSAYNILHININIVEFLIPVTILITAVYNLVIVKKEPNNINVIAIFALAFGLIHGVGFSSYFKIMVDDIENKALPLIEFAIGIEIAQLIIVLFILVVNFIVLNLLKKSKRDWIIVVSSIVIGIVIPMIMERKFW